MVKKKKITRVLSYIFLTCILAVIAVSCSSRSDWIMFRGEQGRGVSSNAINPPLGIKWKIRLQLEDNPTSSFNPPIVKGDTIYFGAPDGNFYALDIESGYMRWVYSSEGIINSIPFADEKNVYFGSNDGKVYAVSQQDGSEVWSFQTESTVQSIIVRYGDLLIFASDGGSAYFVSPQGELQYKLPNPVWHFSAFQVYDNVMYFAPGPENRPFSMGAFDLNLLSYIWILDTAAMRATWYSFPALKNDYLFFSTCVNRIENWGLNYYAYNREDGRLIWNYTEESVWGDMVTLDPTTLFNLNLKLLDFLAPAIWRDTVIYTSGDSVVRAFNSKSGTLKWTRHFDFATSSAPTVAGDRIYFGLRGNDLSPYGQKPRLVCLSARNGKKLWEMDLEGTILSAPVIAGKWLIFGTDANMFYVLEELY